MKRVGYSVGGFVDNAKRIAWGCRRGMLELDLILGPFFQASYEQLRPSQQADFARLLETPDPDLFNLLMGYDSPTDDLAEIVGLIREKV